MLLTNAISSMFDDRMPMMNTKSLMNCDVKEFDDHFELDMDLPGTRKEDIKAEIRNGYLTVSAERSSEKKEEKDGRVIRSERFIGSCRRSFYVGDDVKREDVKASYENGVLKLDVPKKPVLPEAEEMKYIDIQ